MEKMLKLNCKTLEFEELQVPEINLKDLQAGIGTDDTKAYTKLLPINEYFDKARIIAFVDEEGKLKKLPISTILVDKAGSIVEIVAGNILFVCKSEDDCVGLTDKQIQQIKDWLSAKGKILLVNKESQELKEVRFILVF